MKDLDFGLAKNIFSVKINFFILIKCCFYTLIKILASLAFDSI